MIIILYAYIKNMNKYKKIYNNKNIYKKKLTKNSELNNKCNFFYLF